jgi:hypothetical protein
MRSRGDRGEAGPPGSRGQIGPKAHRSNWMPKDQRVLPATGRTRTTGLGRQPGPAGPGRRPAQAQGDPGAAATFRVVTGRDH